MGQVVSQLELITRRGAWKRTGEGVVCAYGAFDLIHPGHIRLLEQARDFGQIFVVAVQSDALVRAIAVQDTAPIIRDLPKRPITTAKERAEIVGSLASVDFVVETDDLLADFLAHLKPDVFVCGNYAEENGSSAPPNPALSAATYKIVRLPLEPGYSTEGLVERISGKHP